jgi:hypothetical protein
MKTTVELADELFVAAKKEAAERRTTLRQLIETGLRRELAGPERRSADARKPIRWVSAKGGLPAGLDLADRARMSEWLAAERGDRAAPRSRGSGGSRGSRGS